jgi:hypothetical protein
MVSESVITPKEKGVSGGKKSSADQKKHRKLNKKPRKVRKFKPNQVEEEDFNASTALGLLESTKTRTLQVTVTDCDIDVCTCTMSDGSDGKKCDGFHACFGTTPDNVPCGSCNGDEACYEFAGESSKSNVQCCNFCSTLTCHSCSFNRS